MPTFTTMPNGEEAQTLVNKQITYMHKPQKLISKLIESLTKRERANLQKERTNYYIIKPGQNLETI